MLIITNKEDLLLLYEVLSDKINHGRFDAAEQDLKHAKEMLERIAEALNAQN